MIKYKLRDFIGDKGLAQAGLVFVQTKENRGILQANTSSLHDVRTGLALINEIDGTKVNVRTLNVSGTLKKIKNLL